MSPHLARTLTRLHAPAWRARYGSEFEALLVELPASAVVMADVAAGIFRSHRNMLVSIAVAGVSIIVLIAMQTSQRSIDVNRAPAVDALASSTCMPYTSILQRKPPSCAVG